MRGELLTAPARCKNPKIPKAINDIVHAGAWRPTLTTRYQRAGDLLDDLLAAAAAGGRGPQPARRDATGRQTDPSARRRDIQTRLQGARDAAAAVLLALPQAAARALGSLPVLRRGAVSWTSPRFAPHPRAVSTAKGVHGFPGTGKIWMNGVARGLGGRQDPHRLARHPLRQRRVRRRPLLRDADGIGLLPPRRAHAAPVRLREDLPDGVAVRSADSSSEAVLDTIRANSFKACYIRPLIYRGYDALGVNPLPLPGRRGHPAVGMGRLSRRRRRSRRASTCASARGPAPRPTRSRRWPRPCANYANSQLIKMEAIADGYAEGIALDIVRLRERRQRREHLRRPRRRHLHAAAGSFDPRRASRATRSSRSPATSASRCAKRCSRARCSTSPTRCSSCGTAVEVTPIRSVDKIASRQRHARAGDRGDPADVLRHRQRRGARHARLAAARSCTGALDRAATRLRREPAVLRLRLLARHPLPRSTVMHINDLLTIAVESGASDLHLKVGSYPMMRVDGDAGAGRRGQAARRTRTRSAMAAAVMSTGAAGEVQGAARRSTWPTACPGSAASAATSSSSAAPSAWSCASSRCGVKTIDELGLPPVLKTIAAEERGLVLVTGTTGSGKSTTLAAMIDHINTTRTSHIMTIEDPIEYLHRDNRSIINQREVGVDTQSFAHALRSALRQDPDVILVGEMRDLETIETALLAAETGHLVLLDAAHARRDRDDQPHHRRLPAAPAEADPHAARQRAEGRHLAAPAAAGRRQGPGRRRSR